jgi:hypothetical protein
MLDTDRREETVDDRESGLSIVDASLVGWSLWKDLDAGRRKHGIERRSDMEHGGRWR